MGKTNSKIYPREKLVKIVQELKKEGKTIGVTNGVFDIIHAGHIDYLNKAKNLCDVLIVSLNTDESVRLYKDPGRPINSQEDRAKVVAALESVDYVTFHDERRMRDTLLTYKPDFYIKAGDYNITELTSRDVLNEWGGEAVLIPPVKGKSTTDIIQKIANIYQTPFSFNIKHKEKSKAVFLDRDGVINEDIEYLHEPEKFKFVKGVIEGIKKLQEAGFKIVVITNQAGIGLGYFTKEDFFKVNKKMLQGFYENGIIISRVYFCPHSLEDNCDCRKPKTGLFERAAADLNIDFKKSWTIGDKTLDIEAGKKAGTKTIKIGEKISEDSKTEPNFYVRDLTSAAEIIISNN